MFRVVVLQHRLLHYRVPFFEALRKQCSQLGIELCLVHGGPSNVERLKQDVGYIDWALNIKNTFFRVHGVDLVWQSLPSYVYKSDLIVLMQENRILSNYQILLGRKLFGKYRTAYWGHGANFQNSNPRSLREKWKRLLSTSVDHWFAYTDMTKDILMKSGYPVRQISVLNNSIDTVEFRRQYSAITDDDISKNKQTLGIPSDAKIGVFCGSIYAEKKIPLLISSSDLIKKQCPDFHLIVIGDGPARNRINEACSTKPWIHYLGIKKGLEKALWFKSADVMLNPGLLGLHILDAFVAGLPIVSTANALHSPELSYLKEGVNGFLTPDSPQHYAQRVIELFENQDLYNNMSREAFADSKHYSLENMVDNFVQGLVKVRDTTA